MRFILIRLCTLSISILATTADMPQSAMAIDSGYHPGYDAIVTHTDAVVKNLGNGTYDASFRLKQPSSPASAGGGETMTMTIPSAPKMSEDEIRETLEMMRKNGMSEEEVLRMESILRTGTMTVPIPASRPGGGAPSGNIAPGDTPAMLDYRPGDPGANSRWAMKLGADMAVAAAYGFTTPDMIKTAGAAVKAFPHPLLLNNYGGMIMDLDPRQALFFFQAADAQQPENSLFLTNVANAFLELEDYAGAERYATMALRIDPMFGPAHVVMAVIHLKNKNMELAAESTVKAARNCFDANVEYLFKSLIEATDRFVWKGDSDMIYEPDKKFPLHDEHMKILYEIAKANVPTNEVNPDIDTPSSQVKIPPFPKIGSPEHLLSMKDYFAQEQAKRTTRGQARDRENSATYRKKEARSRRSAGYAPGIFELDISLRQKYAFKMVELHHRFLLAQVGEKYAVTIKRPVGVKFQETYKKVEADGKEKDRAARQQISDLDREYNRRWSEMFDEFNAKIRELGSTINFKTAKSVELKRYYAQKDQLTKAFYLQLKPFEEKHESDRCRMVWDHVEALLENNRDRNNVMRNYVMEMIGVEEREYLERKQILEEYWLKTGGIMKYASDPLALALLNTSREFFVDSALFHPIRNCGLLIITTGWRLEHLEAEYNSLLLDRERAGKCMQQSTTPKPARTVADAIANAMGGPDTAAEGARIPLSTFEEQNEYKLPVFGVEAEVFKIGASVTADVENMKFTTSLGSPVGGVSAETDVASGNRTMVETLSGGPLSIFNVQADFEPLTPKTGLDRLKELATNKTALGAVVSKLTGPLSMSHEQGTYHTVDPSGRITDRGKVTIKSRGIGFDPLGITETTTINTSATGVTSKTTTRKYTFFFVTVEK